MCWDGAYTGTALLLTIDLVTGEPEFTTEACRVNLSVEIILGLGFFNIIELVVRTTTVDGDLVTKAPYDWMFYSSFSGNDLTPPIATSCAESSLLGTPVEPPACTAALLLEQKQELGLVTTTGGDTVFQGNYVVVTELVDPIFLPLKLRFEEISVLAPALPGVPAILLPVVALGLAIPGILRVSRRRN